VRWKVALILSLGLVGASRAALARKGVRPLFEPTDLELENPGTVEADGQVGLIRSPEGGPWRVVVPDLELDFGVTRRFELDVDLTYSIEEDPPGSHDFNTPAPENLWFAAKVGIYDWVDDDDPGGVSAWALGAQVGPRLPVAPGAHGLGAEGLFLLGHVVGPAHLVLNAGAFVDPAPAPESARPVGLEVGLDLDCDLDASGHFSVTSELAGVRFLSADPHQLSATLGPAWSPVPATQLSLVGLYGLLGGSDRYGVLVGLSQKIRLFGRK
jgi:hypothetical protein